MTGFLATSQQRWRALLKAAAVCATMLAAAPAFALAPGPYKDNDAPVLVVLGQSNGQGWGAPLTGADVSRIGKPLAHVKGLHTDTNRSVAIENVTWDPFTVDKHNLADSSQNTYNAAGEFAKLWDDAVNGGKKLPDLYVIHVAFPGQGIRAFDDSYSNRWWVERTPDNIDSLFPFTNRVIGLAMRSLIDAGKRPRLIGIHWNQWETDAGSKSFPTQADVRRAYLEIIDGFKKTVGGAAYTFFFYYPRAQIYDPAYTKIMQDEFTAMSKDPSLNVSIIDAADAKDSFGNPLYLPNDPNLGIFNGDRLHYSSEVQRWFARKQWDLVFKKEKYGPVVKKVEVPQRARELVAKNYKTDFDGDKKSDLLFTNETTTFVTWLMDGGQVRSGQVLSWNTSTPEWKGIAKGDFDGDGRTDILWFNKLTNEYVIWFINGHTVLRGVTLKGLDPLNNSLLGTGDFDGDKKVDLLWQNRKTGRQSISFMNGGDTTSMQLIPQQNEGWEFEGIGDFDADGKADILWVFPGNLHSVWFMNGITVPFANVMQQPSPGWSPKSVADFDGDGIADVLWYHNGINGHVIWHMSGRDLLAKPSSGWLNPGAPGGYFVEGTGDFDGDGKADILWLNPFNMEYEIWYLDGINKAPRSGKMVTPAYRWTVVL